MTSKEETRKKIYIISGPTAVGKSALGIALAKVLDGEVVSADSMQVYRHMDIGTAKLKPEEMQGIRHHMIDVVEPVTDFDVAAYKQMALECINDICARGKVPVIVGGTGFYIRAVLYDTEFDHEDTIPGLRKELTCFADEKGNAALHRMLEEMDPESAGRLHPNDRQRIIRAIEFYRINGRSISEHNREQQDRKSPFDFRYYVITDDRESIYSRIDSRVDMMMEMGLENEVNELMEMGCRPSMTSMQGIGYKQIIGAHAGNYDMNEAVRLIKRDSRHYAKRQLTWFAGERDVIWIDRRQQPDPDSQTEFIMNGAGYEDRYY